MVEGQNKEQSSVNRNTAAKGSWRNDKKVDTIISTIYNAEGKDKKQSTAN